jgi:hypothetical protein
MFDCLVTADLSTEHPDRVAKLVVDVIGLPPWQPNWVHNCPEDLYRAYFLRAQHDRAMAPTAFEVIGPHPDSGWLEHLRVVHHMQGTRTMKTHATVFSVPDPEVYAKRFHDASVPYFSHDNPNGSVNFVRMFPGQTRDPFSYDPSVDAGLFAEIVPTTSMRLRPEALVPPTVPDVAPGLPVRVASRSFLVDDLDHTLRVVSSLLGWEPAEPIIRSVQSGATVATLRGLLPGSASLELLQPTDAGRVGDYYSQHGAGAYRITFAVNGLEAAASRLDDIGATWEQVDGRGTEPERLVINPAAVEGAVIDLVDFT